MKQQSKSSFQRFAVVFPMMALAACASTQTPSTTAQVRSEAAPAAKEKARTCTSEAREAMKGLGLSAGDNGTLFVDMSQPDRFGTWVPVNEGEVESQLLSTVKGLPRGTRLRGKMVAGSRTVSIHYTEAMLPQGKRLPVCIALGLKSGEGVPQVPADGPGAYRLFNPENFVVVDKFIPNP